MKKRIIIDTDMGSDDSIAVQFAFLNKKFKIEGISLVFGNSSLENAEKNIYKTLDMVGANGNIKIFKGEEREIKELGNNLHDNAFGKNGLGDVFFEEVAGKTEKEHAVDWMIELVNSNPNKITIVTLGPLSNVAKAILKNKDFAKNVKEILIMGGGNNFGNITPWAEFNFYMDPHAANIVLNSDIRKKTVIGFDITKKVTINEQREKKLLDINSERSKFIYKITRKTAELDRKKNHIDGCSVSDATTLCYLVNKHFFKLKKVNVVVDETKTERVGESHIDDTKKSNCQMAVDVNSKKCIKLLFKNLFYD